MAAIILVLLALSGASACNVQLLASHPIESGMLMAPYGEDITVFCSSDDTNNLSFLIDADHLQVEVINATTIKAVVRPDVNPYEISCMDYSEDGCGDDIDLEIVPALIVISPRTRYVPESDYGWSKYITPIGEYYSLYCSGNVVEKLEIVTDRAYERVTLETEVVNNTTVRAVVLANVTEVREYSCSMATNNFIRPIRVSVEDDVKVLTPVMDTDI